MMNPYGESLSLKTRQPGGGLPPLLKSAILKYGRYNTKMTILEKNVSFYKYWRTKTLSLRVTATNCYRLTKIESKIYIMGPYHGGDLFFNFRKYYLFYQY